MTVSQFKYGMNRAAWRLTLVWIATVVAMAAAALLFTRHVHAADLPAVPKAVKIAPAYVATTSPIYIGMFGSAGFSRTESEITLAGQAVGSPKFYPAGFMAGAVIGYGNGTGPLYWGAELAAAYDFSRGSVGCVDTVCLGSRKNGMFFSEAAELGISLSQLGGYIPTAAQPSHWMVPITVPSSVWSNLVVVGRAGFAQRNVTLCAMDMLTGADDLCGAKWINGPLAGAKVKAMLSANTEIAVTYDHVFWKSSFTPQQAVPLFANTVTAKDEDVFRVGLNYHFNSN